MLTARWCCTLVLIDALCCHAGRCSTGDYTQYLQELAPACCRADLAYCPTIQAYVAAGGNDPAQIPLEVPMNNGLPFCQVRSIDHWQSCPCLPACALITAQPPHIDMHARAVAKLYMVAITEQCDARLAGVVFGMARHGMQDECRSTIEEFYSECNPRLDAIDPSGATKSGMEQFLAFCQGMPAPGATPGGGGH
jgi:hypothetical protein